MKIAWAFLNPVKPRGWGGMEIWMLRLAETLAASGDACAVVGRTGCGWEEACADRGLPFRPFDFGMDLHPAAVLRLRRILAELKADVVCAKGFRQARFARLARPAATVAVKLPNPDNLGDSLADRQTFLRAVDRVIVDSHAARERFLRLRWVLPGKVVAVHNGVDLPGGHERETARRDARRTLGAEAGVIVAAVSGRLDPGKRVGDAMAAFTCATKGAPNLRLVVLGDGPERAVLEGRCAGSAVADRVRWMGWRQDARRLLAGCDLLLHASGSEGFPNVVLEAMSWGCVPIATRTGGTPEMIRDGDDGYLVDVGAIEVMSRRIDMLACDGKLRERIAGRARERVARDFTLPRMASEVREAVLDAHALRASLRPPTDRATQGRIWVRRPDCGLDADALDRLVSAGGDLVKATSKSRVATSETVRGPVYIKTFSPRSAADVVKGLLRRPRALANFRSAQRLGLDGVATVPHMAAGWRRDGCLRRESVLVTGTLEGALDLDRAAGRLEDPCARRRLAAVCGRWLGGLHARGILPHDLKPSNILVVDGIPGSRDSWSIALLDLDNLRMGRCPLPGAEVRNLYQLYRSFRTGATRRELLAFAAAYRRKRRFDAARMTRFLRAVDARALRSEAAPR